MGPLKNIRHEKFCQGIVSGLSQTEAYTAAGYSERGAKQSAARLRNNGDVRSRIYELRQEIESSFVPLQITERLQRLEAIQDRWDALRATKEALSKEDYAAAMKTGVVLRKVRAVGHGKNERVVEDYEINSALIEALNSVEKRAATETGQEIDRSDVNKRFGMAEKAEILRRAFTLEELEAIEARIEAAQNGEPKQIEAPLVQPDWQPGCAAPTATDPPETGVVEDGVGPSVPKAPRSWRD